MIYVEKIGGASMSHFEGILKYILKNRRRGPLLYNRIFVVSAYAGITNMLLENKTTKKPGVYSHFAGQRDYVPTLKKLLEKMKQINRRFVSIGLDLQECHTFIEDRVHLTMGYLDSMTHALSSGYVLRDNLLLSAREMLASIGEAHSAFNTAHILNQNGIHSRFIDLSGFNDTEPLTIEQRIKKAIKKIDISNTVPVVTGYVKGIEGIMREFDRGYSEVTFSKVAVRVGADEGIIHKEFHLCSADPKIVGQENAIILGNTNFDVADQLADVGMEAIHPKASKLLENSGIQLRVKDALDSIHPGTLITKDYVGRASRVEIISGSESVTLFEIHDPQMVGTVGFDMEVMEVLKYYNVSYILKSTNANSISYLIWEKHKDKKMIEDLKNRYELVTWKNVAVVCTIGSNIAKPGVLAKAASTLAEKNINILCVAQSMRQVNMQFVIERKDYRRAIIALNHSLCLQESGYLSHRYKNSSAKKKKNIKLPLKSRP